MSGVLESVAGRLPLWFSHAACLGNFSADDDPWFATSPEAIGRALAVCEGCPVRGPCGDYADAHGMAEGVWGGLSERARKAARADDRAA